MNLKEFDQQYGVVVGVDEAGRGPLAGPVVSAAVLVNNPEALGSVNDSKKLSEKRREELYKTIISNCEVGVGIVSSSDIDKINILNATMRAMNIAIQSLKSKYDIVLVDGNLRVKGFNGNQLPIVKGDSKSLAVAAASIVAKVTRDRLMCEYDREFPIYNFKKHKGYGTKEHLDAIETNGIVSIHRKSFLTKYI